MPRRRSRRSRSSSSSSSEESAQGRNPDDTSHDIAAALKHIYRDVSGDAVASGCTRLWKIYVKDRDVDARRNEFVAEIAHRTRLFLEGAQDMKMQLQVLHSLAMLINKCVAEGGDTNILEEVISVIYDKRQTNSTQVRSTTVRFTGQLLKYSLKDVANLEENEFPSTFGKETFTNIYLTLADAADIDCEVTRKVVIGALETLQDSPELMEGVSNPLWHAKHLITVGMFDPSEIVRMDAVKVLDVSTQKDGRYLLEVLLRDTSPAIRQLVATEISQRVPLGVFLLDDVQVVFNDKGLFLGDHVVPEYFDLLLSWAKDTYCSYRRADPDANISVEHLFEGIYRFVCLMSHTKDMHPVVMRMYHRMRTNFKLDELKFVRAYVDTASISINSMNFASFFDTVVQPAGDESIINCLISKLRSILMWYSMVEYTCSHAVPEPIRLEARLLLLPTMTEYAKVFVGVWTQLGELVQHVHENFVHRMLNTIAQFLVKTYEFLESEEVGKAEWGKAIATVLADTSFPASVDTIATVVKNWLIQQLNALSDPDHATNIVADFVHDLNKSDSQLNSTQEMFPVGDNYMDETQMSQTPVTPQQRTDVDPVMYARIIRILTAVVASGVFKKSNPVLEGLVRGFFTQTNITTGAGVDEDICIALASGFPLLETESYLEVQRLVFEEGHRHIYRVCLSMLSDSIMVHGLKKTNELYFAGVDPTKPLKEGTFDPKGNVENLFLSFLDDYDKSFVNLGCRCLLQFIMFDYVGDFKESITELLLRTFMPNTDVRVALLLRQFWINFCSVSREHQCRLAHAYVVGMKKLAVCDLNSPIAKVDKDELTEFVLDVTAYGCLKPNAIDRDFGTAHIYLADKLFGIILKGGDDMIVSDVIVNALNHCEISEAVEHGRLKLLQKAAVKAGQDAESVKNTFETLEKRYRNVLKHLRSNHIPSTVMPIVPLAQLDKELRSVLSRVTSHNERKYSQPWLEISDAGHPQLVTSRNAVEDGDMVHLESASPHGTPQPASTTSSNSKKNAPPKMKMWNERNVTYDQLMAKYSRIKKIVSPEQPPPTITRPRRVASRNNSVTPASPARASTSGSSVNTRSVPGTPISRRRLKPITEHSEVETIPEE
uniref:Cnd3 domain-containing protein n=1 Tax=Panagrellus redivivus TaxID=6233 RepID=A0A7E4VRX1_PANRE